MENLSKAYTRVFHVHKLEELRILNYNILLIYALTTFVVAFLPVNRLSSLISQQFSFSGIISVNSSPFS